MKGIASKVSRFRVLLAVSVLVLMLFSASAIFALEATTVKPAPTIDGVATATEYRVSTDGLRIYTNLGLADPLVNVNGAWGIHQGITLKQSNVTPQAGKVPTNPVYISFNSLPGIPKKDSNIMIRGSKVVDGKVIIPPDGVVYDEGYMGTGPWTKAGGATRNMFGTTYYMVNRETGITAASNVKLPRGVPVQVGDNVFLYKGAAGMGVQKEAVIYVITPSLDEWQHAGESPVLLPVGPAEGTGVFGGKNGWYGRPEQMKLPADKVGAMGDFNQITALAKDVTLDLITASTIYSMAEFGQTWAKTKIYSGDTGIRMTAAGQVDTSAAYGSTVAKTPAGWTTKVDNFTVKVAAVDPASGGKVTVQILEGDKVVNQKVLGPITDESIGAVEATGWPQRNLVLEDMGRDILVYLDPKVRITAETGGQLYVFTDLIKMKNGGPTAFDARYIFHGVLCPQGHNHGAIMYNKDEIVLDAANNKSYSGIAGHFKIVIDSIAGDVVTYHLEDSTGAKTITMVKKGNIDILGGNGWITHSGSMLSTTATLATTYDQLERINKELSDLKAKTGIK